VEYLTTSNISLILQAVLLLGLALGYLWMKQKKLVLHSYIMFTLYLVHILSVLFFMWSSAVAILRSIPFTNLGYLTSLHGLLGVIVLALSTWVIWVWQFQKTVTNCYKMKKKMRILTIFWVSEAIVGLIMYYIIYLQ
jgi:hypothetical protein